MSRADEIIRTAIAASWLLVVASCATREAPPPIAIPGTAVFPESVTSTANGDIIVGSAGTGAVFRAAPGESAASVWIEPAQSGMVSVLGVFADERTNRLYVCSRPPRGAAGLEADAASALRVFALDSGAPLARYAMPGGAADVCNDIAVDSAGAAFVTETRAGRIYRLLPGASALEQWAEDARFVGADGLAFGANGALVFNTVTTHRLFRIQRRADGGPGDVTELTPSLSLQRPDGLRTIDSGRFIMAEAGAGRVTEFTIVGDEARMRALGGVSGTTAMTFARGRVWAVNAKLAYRNDPALGDPGPFEVYSLLLD